jgi:hypothetical protein
MRKPLFLLALLLAGAFVAEPALAQKQDKDKILQNTEPTNPEAADEAQGIMRRTLPFKPVQTLKYFSGKGEYEGYAVRRHNTIRFYDPQGNLVGKAERVTQRLTTYYAPDGTFLGRRTSQKMTTAGTATSADGKGFVNLYELKRPNEEQ